MSCFFGHNWDKWEQYDWHGKTKLISQKEWDEVTEYRQKRKCKNCGKVQDEFLRR